MVGLIRSSCGECFSRSLVVISAVLRESIHLTRQKDSRFMVVILMLCFCFFTVLIYCNTSTMERARYRYRFKHRLFSFYSNSLLHLSQWFLCNHSLFFRFYFLSLSLSLHPSPSRSLCLIHTHTHTPRSCHTRALGTYPRTSTYPHTSTHPHTCTHSSHAIVVVSLGMGMCIRNSRC